MMKRLFLLMILGVTSVLCLNAQTKSLHQLQPVSYTHLTLPTTSRV